MRELVFSDAFHIARIAKKVGIAKIVEIHKNIATDLQLIKAKYTEEELKDESIKQLFDAEIRGIEEQFGIRLMEVLIEGFAEAENEIVYFYSAVTGDKVDTVKQYSFETVIDLFKQFVEINGRDRLIGFFTQAMR